MQRIALGISLILATGSATGCAGSYKGSYVTGAVTKQFATESYNVYSDQFNEKLEACSPANNDSVTTKTELDECMGRGYAKPDHERIERATKVYHEAAKIHTQVMIAVDGSPEERKAATKKLLESAMDLLSLFPEGEKLVKKLKKLTGGI